MDGDSNILIDDYYDQGGFDDTLQTANDQQYFDLRIPAISDVWETCMHPSIVQVGEYMFTYVIWNIAFRIISQTNLIHPSLFQSRRNANSANLPRAFQHLTSIVCGFSLLYFTLGIASFYGLVFTGMTHLLFLTVTAMGLRSMYGVTLGSFCLILLCIGEVLDSDIETWHKMRGTQMIVAMKVISLSFDIDRNRVTKIPNVFEFWGYVMCPGNVIMGPWCSYGDYMMIYQKPKWTLKWFCQVVINFVLAIIFLVASNCLITSFIPDFNFIWLAAYKGAFAYRSSHYFICFFSQCTMLMSGFTTQTRSTRKDKSNLGYSITKPWTIELPRSLVNVVVYWNLSMHYWLKTYVFQQIKPYGKFIAILSTYLISSLLHGINFQLASVLLTLGFATYAEFTIRSKIADIFDACVTAHSCPPETCKHKFTTSNNYVLAINIGFSLLAMINLAYLGIMFEGPIEDQETGSSFNHVLTKWGELGFLTHWIIVFMFILNYFI